MRVLFGGVDVMWLSGRGAARADRGREALLGTVTLEGDRAGAYADGERRDLPVFGPGGLKWRPAAGQEVLILKTGEDGEQGCIAGTRVDGGGLAPGEVALAAEGGGAIVLDRAGTVAIRGTVTINGRSLEEIILDVMTGGEA